MLIVSAGSLPLSVHAQSRALAAHAPVLHRTDVFPLHVLGTPLQSAAQKYGAVEHRLTPGSPHGHMLSDP